MFQFFDLRFAKLPHRFIINGKAFPLRVKKLLDDSWLTEWLNEKGEVIHIWVDRFDHRGLGIAQYSPRELAVARYEEDGTNNILTAVETQIIWPHAHLVTPTFGDVKNARAADIYELHRANLRIEVTNRNESGRVAGGTIKSAWHTTDGRVFEKMQDLVVSFPDPNSMEVAFGGFGEPWAHCDKRRALRLDDAGNLTEERELVMPF